MGNFPTRSSMTRRGFLTTLGTVAGAAVLPGLAAFPKTVQAAPLPSSAANARIGVLIPDTRPYQNIRAGLELGFAEARTHGASLDVITHAIQARPSALLKGAEALIRQGKPTVLTGFAGPQAASALATLLAETRTPFLAADTGANAPRSAEQSPWIYYNTLGYWQASWAMGAWAARNLGRRVVIASSLQEAGYDAIDAFQMGFEGAGGTVAKTVVTHLPVADNEWSGLTAAIRSAKPDFVHALYSGPSAPEFLQAYSRAGFAGRIPLTASPFLVDDALERGQPAEGVLSTLSWAPGLPAADGRLPDAFTVLGYDTARMLVNALGSGTLTAALASVQVTGPRGRLHMNTTARTAAVPLYLRQVRNGFNRLVTPLAAPAETDSRLAPLRANLRTGWLDAHLSV